MNRKPALLATVCLAALTINLDTTIVNVALPSLARELDAGTRDLLWVVDAYNLAFASLVLAMGSLSDRFGRRPALVVGLASFATSSGLAALVDSVGALIAPSGKHARRSPRCWSGARARCPARPPGRRR